MSKQRYIILQELKKLDTHPTADELYPIVKKIMPKISLATVYRNLNSLADQRFILRIMYGGSKARFDGNPDLHYHFRCQYCEKVFDLLLPEIVEINRSVKAVMEHKIEGYHLEFYGVCGSCLKKKPIGESSINL